MGRGVVPLVAGGGARRPGAGGSAGVLGAKEAVRTEGGRGRAAAVVNGGLIVAKCVPRLSQAVSQACGKSSEVGAGTIDQSIGGALCYEHAFLDEAAQVALQRSPVNARALGFEVMDLELTLSNREFQRDALPAG